MLRDWPVQLAHRAILVALDQLDLRVLLDRQEQLERQVFLVWLVEQEQLVQPEALGCQVRLVQLGSLVQPDPLVLLVYPHLLPPRVKSVLLVQLEPVVLPESQGSLALLEVQDLLVLREPLGLVALRELLVRQVQPVIQDHQDHLGQRDFLEHRVLVDRRAPPELPVHPEQQVLLEARVLRV